MSQTPAAFPHRARFIREVLDAQASIMRAFQEQPIPEWLKLDLTLGQLRALFSLFQTGPRPIGQLGASLGLGRPAASLLVDALVRRGLVERFEDPSDRRRTLARLSREATRLITDHYTGSERQYEEWLNRLSEEDLGHLARVMGSLAEIAAPSAASEVG